MPDMLGSHCAALGFVTAYALEYGMRLRKERKDSKDREQHCGSDRDYGYESGSSYASSSGSSDRRVRFRGQDEQPQQGTNKIENMYADLVTGKVVSPKVLTGVAVAGLLAYQVNRGRGSSRQSSERKRYKSVDSRRSSMQSERSDRGRGSMEDNDRFGPPPMYGLRNGSEANMSRNSSVVNMSRDSSRRGGEPRFRTPVYV